MPDTADDLALLRRQAGSAFRAMLRPGTYIGTAREVLLSGVYLAAYPLGAIPPYGFGATRRQPDRPRSLLPDH